jgi:hypothetical protein
MEACPFGYYCVLDLGGSGTVSGECQRECVSFEDCEQPDPSLAAAICTNEGRCAIEVKPPRMIVLEPETDTVYPENTRAVRVTGEVRTAAESVTIDVAPGSERGCSGGLETGVTVKNPNPGSFASMTFVVEGIELDPGPSTLDVIAKIVGARKSVRVGVELACPGCATITVDEPMRRASVSGLELPVLRGAINPAVELASWRVRSYTGDVLDGVLPVGAGGRFSIDNVPLFPGLNRVEVAAFGGGAGNGRARCSTIVTSAVGSERGVRALLLWDGESSDLDLHVIGPNGRFGDPASSLSARGQMPAFGGLLTDDSFGFGPEVAQIEVPPDGVYGLIVEPIVDGGDFGSDATLRLLYDGRPLVRGPIGPRHLTSLDGRLWVAGTMMISGGAATWLPIDELVSAANPPTRPPADWPAFY